MAKSSPLIQTYARMGALARLTELRTEIAEIERAFPGLGSPARRKPGRPRATADTADEQAVGAEKPARKRRKMSAAARKAIGDAQRKRWAKQKAEAKKA